MMANIEFHDSLLERALGHEVLHVGILTAIVRHYQVEPVIFCCCEDLCMCVWEGRTYT